MASTFTFAVTNRVTKGQLATELANPDKKLVSREIYFTTDAAADPTTLYTVPSGKKFILVSIQGVCHRAAGLRIGEFYVYDSAGNAAPTNKRRLFIFAGYDERTVESSSTVYNFDDTPVIFEDGLTVNKEGAFGLRNSEPYSFAITGWLVG